MNKILKGRRLLSLLLAIILLVTMLPSGVLPVSSQEVEQTTSQTEKHPDVDKVAKLKSFFGTAYVDPTNSSTGKVVGNTYYPALVVITGVQIVGSKTYYQLSAAEGNSWPKVAVDVGLTDGFWLESSYVIFVEPCEKCGKLGCESGHENWCDICKVDDCPNDHLRATVTDSEGKVQTIFVAGDLPDGAKLEVSIPEINGEKLPNVFDIKVLAPNENGEMVEWQPLDYDKTIKVTFPVDDATAFVDVFHILDYPGAINNNSVIWDISDVPSDIKALLNDAIVAFGDGSNIAIEAFEKIDVVNGTISITTNSFSIYKLENGSYVLAEDQSGNVTLANITGSNRNHYYYATSGSTFTLKPSLLGFGSYSLESNHSNGVGLVEDWIGFNGVSAIVDLENVAVGEVVVIKYTGSREGNNFFVNITIVREVPVVYDANGKTATGMPNPLSKVIATDGTIKYKIPDGNPSAANCKFKGWALDNAGTGTLYKAGDEFTLTGDLTFYAIWEEDSFDISFNHNYSIDGKAPVVDVKKAVVHDTEISFPKAPVRENYTFLGWCASQNGQGEKYQEGDKLKVHSAATYYAIWGADLTITISGNVSEIKMMEGTEQIWKDVPEDYFAQAGQSANREDVEGFLKGTTFRIKAAGNSNFKASNAYSSSGATVTFWTEDSGKTLFVHLPNGVTVDTTITITTEKDKFTVSYVPNGGTAVEPDLNVAYGNPINPNNKETTRDGYTFDGWYRDAALTQKVTAEVQITAHTAFYAKWKADGYKITYDLDGGSLTDGVTNPDTYDVESEDFTLNNPTKKGYTFAGWTGTGLTEATTVVTVVQGSTGNRNYTATWTPIEYKINYVLTDSDGIAGTNHIDNPANYNIESGEIVLKDPTAPAGYKFVEWVEGNTIAEGSTGEKTFTAVWAPALTAMTIQVTGCNTTLDPNQCFLFTVEGPDGVKLKVTVLENGSVTIHGVTIGQTYTVTMDNAWSWRYSIKNGTDIQGNDNVTSAAVAGNSVTFTLGQNGMLTFKVTRNTDKWLDGNAYYKQ